MQPSVLWYKVKKRLRWLGEIVFPKLAFTYNDCSLVNEDLFRSWFESVPFDPKLSFEKVLPEEDIDLIITKAERLLEHEFDLLGSGPYRFESEIEWHLDFKSGFYWPDNLLHSRIRKVTAPGADIKVPWELSRFNHALTLVLAYLCSSDNKYMSELIDQIQDWITNNPVGYGVNWTCSMDIAIRSVNWLIVIALLNDRIMNSSFSKLRKLIQSSLWQHLCFLRAHLEWLGPKDDAANHLIFDLVGLITLGSFFKETEKGKECIGLASAQLEVQIERQVFGDGVHFECSIPYHRLCLEAFMWSSAIAEKNRMPFSNGFKNKLHAMQHFVKAYIKPSGGVPLIGDNDDGRLISSGILDINDHSYLLPSDVPCGCFNIDRYLLDGSSSSPSPVKNIPSFAGFNDAGFFFFSNRSANLCVRAGNLAHKGTHAHNDQLSFELTIGKEEVFVDRGAYLYTSDPEARNRYRSTSAHNVIQVNNQEQNKLGATVFNMSNQTKTHSTKTSSNSILAFHMGFRNKNIEIRSSREFTLSANSLIIKDGVEPLLQGDFLTWRYHLAPGLTVRKDKSHFSICKKDKNICILNTYFECTSETLCFPHSPSFGKLLDASVIVVKSKWDERRTPSIFVTEIHW